MEKVNRSFSACSTPISVEVEAGLRKIDENRFFHNHPPNPIRIAISRPNSIGLVVLFANVIYYTAPVYWTGPGKQ